MKTIRLLLIFLSLLGTSIFANNVATITAIKGSATITRNNSNIDAKLGNKLQEKDIIKTHENTKVQLIFNDETIISLGKNSNFSVKEFLFEDGKEPVARFGMIKGAMRTITGKIGKIAPQKFSVSTKTATIGIRGTNFSIIAGEGGSHQVFCTYGKISVTYNQRSNIVQQGYYIDISTSGQIQIKEFTPQTLKEMRKNHFGVTKQKSSKLVKNEGVVQASEENTEQLDVTVDDNSGLIVQTVDETNADNVKNDTQSLSDLVASYTMSSADYEGSSYFDDGTTGTSFLNIDFAQDTITLDIIDENDNKTTFSTNPSFSGVEFSVAQTTEPAGGNQNDGHAEGIFQEPTGNQVLGDFAIDDGYGNFATGTYDVSTDQELH